MERQEIHLSRQWKGFKNREVYCKMHAMQLWGVFFLLLLLLLERGSSLQ